MAAIFGDNAPNYWAHNLPAIPLSGKAPLKKGWQHYLNGPPKLETRQEWLERHGDANIGLLMGIPLDEEFVLIAVDGDDDALRGGAEAAAALERAYLPG